MPQLILDRRPLTAAAAGAQPLWASILERVVFAAFVAVVALAPLPFGSARPLAWDGLGLAIAVLLVLSLPVAFANTAQFWRDLAVPLALFGVVALVVIVQVSGLTPVAWHNPVWEQAGTILGRPVASAIAIDRLSALTGLFRLLTYAGAFLLAYALCRRAERAYVAISAIAAAGSLYAAYGLAVFWAGNKTTLWFAKWTYINDLTGPFVNRNSFATYLGLVILVLLIQMVRALGELPPLGSGRVGVAGLVDFLSRRVAIILALFLVITALLLTHSRGGLAATVAGFLALSLAISQAPSLGRYRRLGLIGLAPLLLGVALAISGGGVLERLLDTTSDAQERFNAYAITWHAIRDYPLLGTGLGSFAEVFAIYRTNVIASNFDLAHNDYLQNMLELGIPTAMALIVALLWLAGLCALGLRQRRRDAVLPSLGLAATALVAVHSAIDFSLQIPAVTVTFMVLLGIGVAHSRPARGTALRTGVNGAHEEPGRMRPTQPDRRPGPR